MLCKLVRILHTMTVCSCYEVLPPARSCPSAVPLTPAHDCVLHSPTACLPVCLQMRSFLLCGEGQLHDLHSKLKLDHPNSEANQLHK